jgi:hypothetical protein
MKQYRFMNPRKGKIKMAKATKEKAVKAPIAVNSSIATDYAVLIESGESTNLEALNFIKELGDKLGNGITEEVAKESMKSVLKDVNVKPVVLPSHVSALKVAARIIARFESEISDIKASKVLSLATRVICDKKASGAESAIKSAESFADLDESILSKAESQARDAQNQKVQEIKESKDKATIEAVVDGFHVFLGTLDLRTATTKERKKLDALVAKLHTISTNTKAMEKVNA